MTGGRPRRPAIEARLVREAAAGMDPAAPREPIARIIAERVIVSLTEFLNEGDDPVLMGLGDLRRRAFPTPIEQLATHPDVDTIGLYVERAVLALRGRSGRTLGAKEAGNERVIHLKSIQTTLEGRYLRHLRSSQTNG